MLSPLTLVHFTVFSVIRTLSFPAWISSKPFNDYWLHLPQPSPFPPHSLHRHNPLSILAQGAFFEPFSPSMVRIQDQAYLLFLSFTSNS